jgi:hypothetical protein
MILDPIFGFWKAFHRAGRGSEWQQMLSSGKEFVGAPNRKSANL